MDYFCYQKDRLRAESVDLQAVAEKYGTPCYVYSRATLERHWRVFDQAFGQRPHLVCYAVKANSNLAILNLLAQLGAGFDIVSGGELERVLSANGNPQKIVFSGVGKTEAEIEKALAANILCFNIESSSELYRINDIAGKMDVKAPISFRVNPDVDAQTHPYIATGLKENKFGLDIETAFNLYQQAVKLLHIEIVGIDCHIGSQLTSTQPFIEALQRLMLLIDRLKTLDIHLTHIDLGGGLGVKYYQENPPDPATYVQALNSVLGTAPQTILLEPGRAIAANAGVLLTKVEYLKSTHDKHFAIVDAAMNDLIRPALYEAWQDIIPVIHRENAENKLYDIVGPICESGDFLGKQRPLAIKEGDILAIRSSGAYGFVMSSNYNSRPRAAELMVDEDAVYTVRRRETVEDLMALESMLPS